MQNKQLDNPIRLRKALLTYNDIFVSNANLCTNKNQKMLKKSTYFYIKGSKFFYQLYTLIDKQITKFIHKLYKPGSS